MKWKSAKQKISDKVQKSYEQISGDYDAISDITSLGTHRIWKLRAAKEISGKKFTRVLDACCGTGDMALLLASRNRWLSVTGVDFSMEMLKVAERRRKKKGLDNLQFVRADAGRLSCADGHYDCAVISYGLRDAADPERVLREMCRVLRPGGFVYCIDSYQPEEERIQTICRNYRKYVVPAAGAVLAGKGRDYKRLADIEDRSFSGCDVAGLLRKCGFTKVGCLTHLGGIAACHRGQKPVDNL